MHHMSQFGGRLNGSETLSTVSVHRHYTPSPSFLTPTDTLWSGSAKRGRYQHHVLTDKPKQGR